MSSGEMIDYSPMFVHASVEVLPGQPELTKLALIADVFDHMDDGERGRALGFLAAKYGPTPAGEGENNHGR